MKIKYYLFKHVWKFDTQMKIIEDEFKAIFDDNIFFNNLNSASNTLDDIDVLI